MKCGIVLIFVSVLILSILPKNEGRPSSSVNSLPGFFPHSQDTSTSQKAEILTFEFGENAVPQAVDAVPIQSDDAEVDNSIGCRNKRDIPRGQDDQTSDEPRGQQRTRTLNELNKSATEKKSKRSLLTPGATNQQHLDPTHGGETTTPSPASYFALAWIHSFMMK